MKNLFKKYETLNHKIEVCEVAVTNIMCWPNITQSDRKELEIEQRKLARLKRHKLTLLRAIEDTAVIEIQRLKI